MTTKQERLHALENQIQRIQKRLTRLERLSDQYGWVRLAIFLLGCALSILVFILWGWWPCLLTALLTITLFSIVAWYHRKVDRSITRHKIWSRIKSTHIARIQLDWNGIPPSHLREPHQEHPFESDLDITGEQSLHQLINTAVSYEGSQRLAEWLLNTAPDADTIHKRQALVRELAPLTRFRDKLTLKSLLTASNVAEHLEGKKLLLWLTKSSSPGSLRSMFIVSISLAALTILLLFLNLFAVLPPLYWIASFILAVGWFYARRKQLGDLFEDAYFLRDAFAQLSTIFEFLETYPYGQNPYLKKLCEPFFLERQYSPSRLLKRLSRIASAATLEKNQVLWLLVNALVPWDTYVALRLKQYKALVAARLPAWLDAWFELEALSSLASFAYLNPQYILPEVLAGNEQSCDVLLRASGLGHPLIKEEQKMVNDFAVDKAGAIVIITGSNMSGKSTFLRTLGINLCLAYAGGPVNASSFQSTLFKVYTCIKVSDSVTEGYSYFYAEVKRLKAILEELERNKRFPLFILIDEIFKGTNNRERLIGSRAYIQSLVSRNCIAVISTHDLELVKLADILPETRNEHFREEVINGQMVFDYILRNGPCPTTNALKIMQMEGLPVEL